jgi:DNA transposition AAA+ family ATPase
MKEDNQKKPEDQDDKPIVQTNNGNNARSSWPISMHNLRTNIGHMRPESKQLLVDCFLWCINQDITKAEFASGIGSSDNTVYKWITGRYTHPQTGERLDISDKMLKAMNRWLDDQKAKIEIQTDFIQTPSADKVFLACRLALESRTPVFLWGPSHIGKTIALVRFAKTNNHGRTIYVRLGAASGLGGMLREIAKVLGVSYESSKERMIQFIINGMQSDMLLILDEVHELLHTYRQQSFFACIEVIREIYDRVGCGMVLCVTKIKWDEFSKHKKNDLEQMFRRGVHRVGLGTESGQPLKKDIEMILLSAGLKFPGRDEKIEIDGITESPFEMIRQLSKDDGLKSITERIRYAKILAEKAGLKSGGWEEFTRAHLIIASNAKESRPW